MTTMLSVESVKVDGFQISLAALRVGTNEVVWWSVADAPALLSDLANIAAGEGYTPKEIVVVPRRLLFDCTPATACLEMKIKGGVVFVTE